MNWPTHDEIQAALREAVGRGLSVEQIAEEVGLHANTIRNYARGGRTRCNLKSLARFSVWLAKQETSA